METPRDEVQKACVLGSGAFGTALAQLMARKGVPTTAWTRSQDVTDLITRFEVFSVGFALTPCTTKLPTRAAALQRSIGRCLMQKVHTLHDLDVLYACSMTMMAVVCKCKETTAPTQQCLFSWIMHTSSRKVHRTESLRIVGAVVYLPS
ncbi:unnamed protein product, partial [Ectocarpus sp. 13 AM-2016]